MRPRKSWIDSDVLELIEHLFRRGTRGLLCVSPWRLGEVLLGGRLGSRGSGSGRDRWSSGDAARDALVRAALVELAWALRSIAVLRLAAAPRSTALLLLERGVAISPAALTERLIARFGSGGVLPDFLPANLHRGDGGTAGEAQRTRLLAELALELAPSDAGRITLALAERGEGHTESALALLRDVLTSEPDACDAASAWLDVAAHHASVGRPGAAARAAARSQALLGDTPTAPLPRASRPGSSAPVPYGWMESVPV